MYRHAIVYAEYTTTYNTCWLQFVWEQVIFGWAYFGNDTSFHPGAAFEKSALIFMRCLVVMIGFHASQATSFRS